MEAKSWIERVANEPPAAVARKIGLTASTLDSQMKSTAGLKPETVVKIARVYRYDRVVALVEHGLLVPDDVGGEVDLSDIEHLSWLSDESRATDDVLLTEIGRRLTARANADEAPAPATDEFTKKRAQRQRPAPNLPAKKSARPKPGKPKMGDE